MNTIADKLEYLEDTKTAIGNAIAAKGGSVTGKTFRQYATEISNLPSGGGGTQDLVNLIERYITSLVIPNTVSEIGDYAFCSCNTLVSVTIPSSVTSIGYSSFSGCGSLTSITIPDSVISIGSEAFNICGSLTSATIGNGVTSIGSSAFEDCPRMTSFTCEATTPPTIDEYVFDNTNNCPIYVPTASVEAYKAADNWSTYASRIQAIPNSN